jgi:transketolase
VKYNSSGREPAEPLHIEAHQLRHEILVALHASGGGHYGGCLSIIDVLLALYRRHLYVKPREPAHPDRDRVILSKGHAALALYAVLRRMGFFNTSLNDYASYEAGLEGHPDMTSVPGVDFSTGSLGQGLSVGLGMAEALRTTCRRVWVILGDGECQEGQIWEAATLASIRGLTNLVAIVDHNRFQEWGWSGGSHQPPMPNIGARWAAFGWRVLECDGHDFESIEQALRGATSGSGSPTVILAHTTKGKGVPLIERDPIRFHCETVTDAEHEALLHDLRAPA